MFQANILTNIARKKLSEEQKYFWRNLLNARLISPPLSDSLVLILGCQRSGTTLTLLLLNAHPQITGIDETEFPSPYPFPNSGVLLANRIKHDLTCLKLPVHVSKLDYITRYFPKSKIIWPVRNPFSTISSMRSLTNIEGNWIERCAKDDIKDMVCLFPEIKDLDLDSLDEISLGAYVWKYKNLAIDKFKQNNLNVFDFKYEDLLENPRDIMSKMLDFVGLKWSDRVLNHEQFYNPNASYAGNTRGDKPLDKTRVNARLKFSEQEVNKVNSIGQELIDLYKY
jgi:protein-tyrosine sulfotransferase